tara:strand:+ start:230 stop:496 length:267 start_codon:yes stop_codon:yes gene_type:complete
MDNEKINKLKELLCKRDGVWNERLKWEIERRKNHSLNELIEKVENGHGDEMDKDNLHMVFGKELQIKFLDNIKTIDEDISNILEIITK